MAEAFPSVASSGKDALEIVHTVLHAAPSSVVAATRFRAVSMA